MTKAELEKKVVELLDQNQYLNEELNNSKHLITQLEQGGAHTEAYDELMDRARELQRDLNQTQQANKVLRKTINVIRAAVE